MFQTHCKLLNVIPIISDLILIHFDLFQCFYAIFDVSLRIYLTYCYIKGLSHTIVYLSDVFSTLSNLLQSLFIFALINVPMFWLFLMVDRFH